MPEIGEEASIEQVMKGQTLWCPEQGKRVHLVHERLVEHLRRRGFDNLTFLDPAQCAL